MAGGSAQAEFERRTRRRSERMRQKRPLLIGIVITTALVVLLIGQAVEQPGLGVLGAIVAALAVLGAVVETPQTTASWRTGAEGERQTARYLAGLGEAGFITLNDRRVAGYGGNLDHVAIGPGGVWVVETKNMAGKVEIHGDSLRIGGYRQDKMVDQVYREAAAVQVAMGESLTRLGLTVKPVICIHRAELPFFNKTVRGVRLASGKQLVRLLLEGDERLEAEEIHALAREAERVLRPAAKA